MHQFLKHQWLRFNRSPSFSREMGVTVLIMTMAAAFTFGIILLSFLLPRMVQELAGGVGAVRYISRGVVYYFVLEFVLRYLIQKMPVMDVQPYLVLPVRRSKIASYFLGRSFLSLFNLYPVILIVPLAMQIILPDFGMLATLSWAVGIIFISWSVHFIQLILRSKFEDKAWVWLVLIGLVISNYLADYWLGYDLLQPVSQFFVQLLYSPVLVFIPVGILFISAFGAYRFLKNNLYLEELLAQGKRNGEQYSKKIDFLGRKGLMELYMLQEIRLILRHKRTRSVILLSLLFVPYGLLFFGSDEYANTPGIFVLIGIFISGLFTINYGQFFWGWKTNQLDFYFSRPVSLRIWVLSRYRLLVLSAVISTLLCTPYIYFGWEYMFVILCCSLFNIGVNIPLMMRISMWQPKAIDLNRSSFMNLQGTGLAQWIMGIPLLLIPYLIYLPVRLSFGFLAGVSAVGIAGLIAFALRDYLIDILVQHLKKLKYQFIKELTL